jgi:hypothetical protein
MGAETTQPRANVIGALQRFVRKRAPQERCELCGAAVSAVHEHLIEPASRRMVCACQACAILFPGDAGQRYKRVPSRIRFLSDFRMSDGQWDSLMVPINMAFFVENSAASRMTAVYPSPAGATESQLPLETWQEIIAENPVLQTMQPDVEALLVNRLGERRGFPVNQYYLLPIDQCFKLVGLVRMHWRGLSGGEDLWQELGRYFAGLAAHSVAVAEHRHA